MAFDSTLTDHYPVKPYTSHNQQALLVRALQLSMHQAHLPSGTDTRQPATCRRQTSKTLLLLQLTRWQCVVCDATLVLGSQGNQAAKFCIPAAAAAAATTAAATAAPIPVGSQGCQGTRAISRSCAAWGREGMGWWWPPSTAWTAVSMP